MLLPIVSALFITERTPVPFGLTFAPGSALQCVGDFVGTTVQNCGYSRSIVNNGEARQATQKYRVMEILNNPDKRLRSDS
jgi:hypothetical protein